MEYPPNSEVPKTVVFAESEESKPTEPTDSLPSEDKQIRTREKSREAILLGDLEDVEEEDKDNVAATHLLSLVCSLGQLSFHAYDDPKLQGFGEFTTTANRVRYLSWTHLHKSLKGVLKIHLKHARNVFDADFGPSKSDPYVVFNTGGSQIASEFKKDDENPVWNSTHYLIIRKESCLKRDDSQLQVRMFDSDWGKGKTEEREHRRIFIKDDPIGSATLDMSELTVPGVKSWDITLNLKKDKRKEHTTIAFDTEFLTFETACDLLDIPRESDTWSHKIQKAERNWTDISEHDDIGRVLFQPIAFINGVKTGTQVWIHSNIDAKAVVVAFRGTEALHIKDLVADLAAIPSKLEWGKFGSCSLLLSESAKDPKITIHSGFKRAYGSVWSSIMEIVYNISGWSKDWTICITGHSLGGALATLCSFDFSNRSNEDGTKPHIILMNFGAPRIGNNVFVERYKATVQESYRVVNRMDVIHKIPVFLKHVGTEIRFEAKGDMYVNKKQVLDLSDCKEAPKEEKKEQEKNKGEKEKGKNPSEDNPGILENIVLKITGLKGHFEDYYFAAVKRAIANFFTSDKEKLRTLVDKVVHAIKEPDNAKK